jgi:hypothetical protein
MADSEPSISERQLAEELEAELFSPPRSVGEAVSAAVEQPEIQVEDAPVQPDTEEEQELPQVAAEPEAEGEAEEEAEEEAETEADHIVWAKKRWGEDPEQWARGAYEGQQHLSRLMNEKKEAEQLAVHWYEAAQAAEQQATTQAQMGMPLSAQEENWVETVAMQNPHEAMRQAAYANNATLYNAIVNRVAEESPGVAANLAAQVQMEMQQLAAAEQMEYQPRPLEDALKESFARLRIDLEKDGQAMREKVGELGEFHPYVQAILNGDDAQRDLGVQAIHDLVREGRVTRRRVVDETRESAIKREAELRRAAAGVVTGAPHTPPATEDPLLAAMTEEWKARRQWGEE